MNYATKILKTRKIYNAYAESRAKNGSDGNFRRILHREMSKTPTYKELGRIEAENKQPLENPGAAMKTDLGMRTICCVENLLLKEYYARDGREMTIKEAIAAIRAESPLKMLGKDTQAALRITPLGNRIFQAVQRNWNIDAKILKNLIDQATERLRESTAGPTIQDSIAARLDQK
jgi:hypothetical protein